MSINKEMLESIFAKYYIIDPPKNVLVLDRPAATINRQGFGYSAQFYKGLQPKWRGDLIIVTPQGDDETVIHETLHAQFCAEEPLANVGGKVLILKHRILERGGIVSKILKVRVKERTVNYQLCHGCSLCRDLSQLKLYTPVGAQPTHYVLVDYDGR